MIQMLHGETAALATAFCWTVTAMSFEYAGRRIGSLPVNIIRLGLALIFLSIYSWIARGRALPLDAAPHAWFWLSLSGLVGFTFGDLCLFRAFVLIGSRTSMLLMTLVPVLTAFAGWAMMGEVLTAMNWAGLVLTMSGIVLVVSERKFDENGVATRLPFSGILLGLGAAVGQAGGLVLAKYGMAAFDPFASTQIRALAGFMGFVAVIFAAGLWPRIFDGLRHAQAMSRVALGAFFGPFIGVSLSLAAVQTAKAGVAATLMSITPILLIAPARILFKEKITPRAVAGAVLAVAGVGLLLLFKTA